MSDEVSWFVELVIKPGQLDGFRVLTREMIESSRREAGIINYERFISDDGTVVYAYERYENSRAALTHLQTFEQTFSRRFLRMVERRRCTVFGVPTPERSGVLDRLGAAYARPFG